MTKMYYDQDADLSVIQQEKVAVIGYGSQGHAQAQNLKESGVQVAVGLREGSASRQEAEEAGLPVMNPGEAAAWADMIQVLIPDEKQQEVYTRDLRPFLTEGKALIFSHGFNIHFQLIVPPANVDVFMVAPKGPGHLVRRMYVEGAGVPSLLAVYQDYTGRARDRGLAYARAIGGTRAGVIETTFREETETDLFGEQAVLCGGTSELVKAGFDTLVEAGYQPEIAYFECLHELKLIVDLMYEGGLSWMRHSISNTAQFGDFTRGRRIITEETRREMKKILKEVQEGVFAREWILENQAHRPVFNAIDRQEQEHLIETVGTRLRQMMPWIKARQ